MGPSGIWTVVLLLLLAACVTSRPSGREPLPPRTARGSVKKYYATELTKQQENEFDDCIKQLIEQGEYLSIEEMKGICENKLFIKWGNFVSMDLSDAFLSRNPEYAREGRSHSAGGRDGDAGNPSFPSIKPLQMVKEVGSEAWRHLTRSFGSPGMRYVPGGLRPKPGPIGLPLGGR